MRSSLLNPMLDPPSEEAPAIVGGINVAGIIIRMRKVYEVKTDAELAKNIGVAKTTISSWRKRNSIPLDVCVKAASDNLESLDYIVSGEKKIFSTESIFDIGIDVNLMEICLYAVQNNGVGKNLPDTWEAAAFRARVMLQYYARGLALMKETVDSGAATRENFLRALRKNYDVFAPTEEPVPNG